MYAYGPTHANRKCELATDKWLQLNSNVPARGRPLGVVRANSPQAQPPNRDYEGVRGKNRAAKKVGNQVSRIFRSSATFLGRREPERD